MKRNFDDILIEKKQKKNKSRICVSWFASQSLQLRFQWINSLLWITSQNWVIYLKISKELHTPKYIGKNLLSKYDEIFLWKSSREERIKMENCAYDNIWPQNQNQTLKPISWNIPLIIAGQEFGVRLSASSDWIKCMDYRISELN